MTFRPAPGDTLEINHLSLSFTADPTNPAEVFQIRGHTATIYQLSDPQGKLFALKVFTLAHRSPHHQVQAESMAAFNNLPGLRAAERTVIVPIDHAELVIRYPELRYAVLMPWLDGQTWAALKPSWADTLHEQRYQIARSLAGLLARMEERGIAHSNLCPANLLVDGSTVQLVDLEDMVLPGIAPSEVVVVEDPAYGHPASEQPTRDAAADRYAGAMLLAEILGDGSVQRLEEEWGEEISALSEQAMQSTATKECPAFLSWNRALEQQSSSPADDEELTSYGEIADRTTASEVSEPQLIEVGFADEETRSNTINWKPLFAIFGVIVLIIAFVTFYNDQTKKAEAASATAAATARVRRAVAQTESVLQTEIAQVTATAEARKTQTAIAARRTATAEAVREAMKNVNVIAPHNVQFHFGHEGVTVDCKTFTEKATYSQEEIFIDEWFYLAWKHNEEFADMNPRWSLINMTDEFFYIYNDKELSTDPDQDNCGWQGFSLEGIEPGNYLIEIEADGKTYYRENFTITYYDLSSIPRPNRPTFGQISFGRNGWDLENCNVYTETTMISQSELADDEWLYFTSPFQLHQVGLSVAWRIYYPDGSLAYDVDERDITDNIDLCFQQGFSMEDEPVGTYTFEAYLEGELVDTFTFAITR